MNLKPIVFAVSMLLAATAWADAPNADTNAAPAAPAAASAPPDMPMSMPMPAEAPMPADDVAADSLQEMDANLDKMHQALAQMKETKDPAERKKLMQDYMSAQHDNMMLAHTKLGLGGAVMAGGGMGGMGMGGMGMGRGMGMMGRKDCDMDHMRGMHKRHEYCPCEEMKMDDARERGGKGGGMGGMGRMGRMGGMGGMGGMRGMGGMGMMGGMKDDATAARLQSLEKRIDMLQDMMKMMMMR
ncbi:MAG: hypothetical protein WBP86_13180 [Thiobacillaceae bacterium]